jgi:hypothetical protein
MSASHLKSKIDNLQSQIKAIMKVRLNPRIVRRIYLACGGHSSVKQFTNNAELRSCPGRKKSEDLQHARFAARRARKVTKIENFLLFGTINN